MPDSLLGISIPRSSRKSTVPCPLSHCSQLPHPRVRGRSPLGSESCPVPPPAPPPRPPVWSARTGPQRSLHPPPPSRHRCSLDGWQNSLGSQVLALSSTSRGSPLLPPSTPTPLLTGSCVGVQGEPEQRESQQGGEDPYLGNHPSSPGPGPQALSRAGTWGKVR